MRVLERLYMRQRSVLLVLNKKLTEAELSAYLDNFSLLSMAYPREVTNR